MSEKTISDKENERTVSDDEIAQQMGEGGENIISAETDSKSHYSVYADRTGEKFHGDNRVWIDLIRLISPQEHHDITSKIDELTLKLSKNEITKHDYLRTKTKLLEEALDRNKPHYRGEGGVFVCKVSGHDKITGKPAYNYGFSTPVANTRFREPDEQDLREINIAKREYRKPTESIDVHTNGRGS
jgi:hypothetical protein